MNSVVLLRANTLETEKWIVDNVVYEDYQVCGRGVVVDRGSIETIVDRMVIGGLVEGRDFDILSI